MTFFARYVAITTGLIYMIACILQGEAGAMGEIGMIAVADTMLSRRECPEFPRDWDSILSAYNAYDPSPSQEALAIAFRMIVSPWKPLGYVYVYSESDRRHMGWRRGEKIVEANGFRLNLSKSWPGD